MFKSLRWWICGKASNWVHQLGQSIDPVLVDVGVVGIGSFVGDCVIQINIEMGAPFCLTTVGSY
jgi:hypothetical protein